ncbi:MAG: aldo/keto reductase, partial [Alphaproteobacteria bacterium]|nr:aldo/keto reductase [Alphaproteobacteria bacterium]
PLGDSGLLVPEIGFGCGPTAGLMISGDEREQVAVVAAAIEQGVRYFDTAARYGDGRSERNLGRALRALSTSAIVATKVTIEDRDLDDIAGAVVASVEASLGRLGMEAVAIVHLHNRVGGRRAAKADQGSGILLSVDDVLGPKGVADGFERLRRRGLVEHVGGCGFGGEMPALAQVTAAGVFDSLLVNYSMINPSAFEPATVPVDPDYRGIGSKAAGAGMGIVALRVLEGGLLTGRSPDPAAGHLAFVLDECETLTEAAVRHALSNPAVSTVLVGISDRSQLDAAVVAAKRGALPKPLLDRIRSRDR